MKILHEKKRERFQHMPPLKLSHKFERDEANCTNRPPNSRYSLSLTHSLTVKLIFSSILMNSNSFLFNDDSIITFLAYMRAIF